MKLNRYWRLLRMKYRRFLIWQQQKPQVAPMTAEEHTCATCSTQFTGYYCPRCGQRSNIGRFSARTMLFNFLDVWGMGNRGMFRSIRDLLLRPGYLVRDYLSGTQMAYFPPFKMLFVILTICFLLKPSSLVETDVDKPTLPFETTQGMIDMPNPVFLMNEYPVQSSLFFMVVAAPMFYLLFRKSPKLKKPRISEVFVALVFRTTMVNIVEIIGIVLEFLISLTGITAGATIDSLVHITKAVLQIAMFHQLFGYSLWGTFWRLAVAFITFLLIVFGIIILAFIAFGVAYGLAAPA